MEGFRLSENSPSTQEAATSLQQSREGHLGEGRDQERVEQSRGSGCCVPGGWSTCHLPSHPEPLAEINVT